ncbi:MAG: diguanylate cyclase [Thermoguttaceae bacterium]
MEPTPAVGNLRALDVLLVDDDPAMLRLVSKWLIGAGYQVESVGDGHQALIALERHCPDFLITDWDMPNMDGLELCRRVRQLELPHYVYVLFLTVKSAPQEVVAGLEVGADDFLPKPIDQAELLARLRAGSRVLALERRLSQMARTDPLTGLLSRRTFFDVLAREWERAKRFSLPMSCVMADLDFFKRVNDLYGHPAGDAILKTVANLLQEGCRASDAVCRYGGEEFCVLLPETREHDAAGWAERLRKRIGSLVFPVGTKELRITCSFGTAQNHADTQTCEQLVDQADQALLCAKRSGRDRVVRFESLCESSELELGQSADQESLFEGTAARHVMTPVVACLREDDSIGQAAEFFLRSRINSTPVADKQGRLAGILSEKDLMAALVSLESWHRPIREVMKPNVICYEEDTPIRTIYEFLCRVTIRRVVITDQGRPTGTISRGTLLRWFRNLVVAKGLLAHNGPPASAGQTEPDRSRRRLSETARELAQQVAALEDRLRSDPDDPVPSVVGGVTRMQELLDDLLAYSRYGNPAAEAHGVLQALAATSGLSD